MIGQIIAAGAKGFGQRWMYVTSENDLVVCGRMWSARSGKWTKSVSTYGRNAVNCGTPKCPKPAQPQKVSNA
jgi:hypothetical protein